MEAIRRAAAGERSFLVATRTGVVARLSPRELEITRLVADGRTNDEIAGTLAIGTKTVEAHLARLFERFQLASRTELATRALRDGWLDIPAG